MSENLSNLTRMADGLIDRFEKGLNQNPSLRISDGPSWFLAFHEKNLQNLNQRIPSPLRDKIRKIYSSWFTFLGVSSSSVPWNFCRAFYI